MFTDRFLNNITQKYFLKIPTRRVVNESLGNDVGNVVLSKNNDYFIQIQEN